MQSYHALRRRLFPAAIAAVAFCALAPVAQAQDMPLPSSNAPVDASTAAGFSNYLESLRGKARAMGVSDATFNRAITGLSFNPRVAALDRGNGPTVGDAPIPPFEPYKQKHIDGRKIATTFWGASWCDNLERYGDFANRLPRGRSYVRNGAVVDLQIAPGVTSTMPSTPRTPKPPGTSSPW